MVRIANGRSGVLSSAELSLHMLKRTVSTEGVQHAYVVELPLLRDRVPGLAILFTLMHVIDETSPLLGYHAAHEAIPELRLILSIRGYDPSIGQTVADTRSYYGPDLRFGMRYVDAVVRDERGRVVADYSQIGTIVADLPSPLGDKGGGLA